MQAISTVIWGRDRVAIVALGCAAIAVGTFAFGQEDSGEEHTREEPPSVVGSQPVVSREEIAEAVVDSPFSLPSPVSWFRAFNKTNSPRWRNHIREGDAFTITDRSKAALVLGASLTDAYVAIESRAAQDVRNALMNVRSLEKTLGISDRMQQRHARMGELADSEHWNALRVEVEACMAEQRAALTAQRDQPLADLLPFGLLLRAMEVNCEIIIDRKIEDERMCIGDSTLLIRLIRMVEALPERTLKDRAVRDLRRCLKALRDCWDEGPRETGEESPAVQNNIENRVLYSQQALQGFLRGLHVNE